MGVFVKASRNLPFFFIILVNSNSNIFPIGMKNKSKNIKRHKKKLSQYNAVTLSGEKIKHIEADRGRGDIPKSVKKM